MAYPVKYRKRTIEYRQEGHTLENTSQVFKVSIPTIRKWEEQLKNTGNLKDVAPKRKHKKINPEKLKEYVSKYPDAYLSEIAKNFACSEAAVCKAMKKHGFTRKKRQSVIKNKILQK